MGRPRKYDEKYGSQKAYRRKHETQISLKLYDTNSADMIAWLKFKAGEDSPGSYLRRLIREDMDRNGFVYTPDPEEGPQEG